MPLDGLNLSGLFAVAWISPCPKQWRRCQSQLSQNDQQVPTWGLEGHPGHGQRAVQGVALELEVRLAQSAWVMACWIPACCSILGWFHCSQSQPPDPLSPMGNSSNLYLFYWWFVNYRIWFMLYLWCYCYLLFVSSFGIRLNGKQHSNTTNQSSQNHISQQTVLKAADKSRRINRLILPLLVSHYKLFTNKP